MSYELNEYKKKWWKKNSQRMKDHRANPEVKKHNNEIKKKYAKKKYHTDPLYKMGICLRNRLNHALNGELKADNTMKLIGCSVEFFKEYLEKQFKSGMTWKNHTIRGWHIDHIIPCNSFDLSDFEQQKKCFHYTNMQPLWSDENIKKSNKIL